MDAARIDGEKWYTIHPKRTQTWAVIRSQRFLKLEGKSFHTSLFFVSLFVLTFVRLHCVYCVGALSIILHIIIVVVVVAVALQSVGWCDDAYLVRVTVLHRTCCWWYGCRCRHRACGSYERNNAQKKIKSEQNVEEEKMSWGSGFRIMTNAKTQNDWHWQLQRCYALKHSWFSVLSLSLFCVPLPRFVQYFI